MEQPFRVVFAFRVVVNCAGFGWLFADDGQLAQWTLDRTISSYWTVVTDSRGS